MVKELKNTMVTKQIIIIVILAFAIVVALILWRNNYVSNQKTETQDKVITTEDQYPIDTLNDGVYTNYKYSFRFEYPNSVFGHQNLGAVWPSWYNEEYSGESLDPTAYSKSALRLDVIVRDTTSQGRNDVDGTNYREMYIKRFNEFLTIRNGEKVSWGAQKLSEKSSGNYKLITFFYKTPEDKASEISTYYGAWWLKDESPVIEVHLIGGSSGTLISNKILFDNVVSSFDFIEK